MSKSVELIQAYFNTLNGKEVRLEVRVDIERKKWVLEGIDKESITYGLLEMGISDKIGE